MCTLVLNSKRKNILRHVNSLNLKERNIHKKYYFFSKKDFIKVFNKSSLSILLISDLALF